MIADSLADNTPNAPELSAQFVFPSPKVLNFNEKKLHWASVVLLCILTKLDMNLEKTKYV
jgi:hypothetical protein